MPTIEFPDGTRLAADTYPELMDKWHGKRWNRGRPKSKFRRILARRAIVWSGDAVVHPDAAAKQIVEQCAEAEMLTIIEA
jgi:hypothetical protein